MTLPDSVVIAFFAGVLFLWGVLIVYNCLFWHRCVRLKYKIGDIVLSGDEMGRVTKIYLKADEWSSLPKYNVIFEIDTGYRILQRSTSEIDDRVTQKEYAVIKNSRLKQVYSAVSPDGRADYDPTKT